MVVAALRGCGKGKDVNLGLVGLLLESMPRILARWLWFCAVEGRCRRLMFDVDIEVCSQSPQSYTCDSL